MGIEFKNTYRRYTVFDHHYPCDHVAWCHNFSTKEDTVKFLESMAIIYDGDLSLLNVSYLEQFSIVNWR